MTNPSNERRFRAPHRIETQRLRLCALGPEWLAQVHSVVPTNKEHLAPTMPWVQGGARLPRSLRVARRLARREALQAAVRGNVPGLLVEGGLR